MLVFQTSWSIHGQMMYVILNDDVCARLACFLVLVLLQSPTSVGVVNQCYLQNGQCTYNILLTSQNGGCSDTGPIKENHSDDRQNDNKMSLLEQNFDTVKTDHEDRIRELESSVQKLLRDAVPGGNQVSLSSVPVGTITRIPGSTRTVSNRSENSLLSRLSQEFSNLRGNLRDKTVKLLDTETKLNETNEILREAQEDLFTTGEDLVIAEHNAALFRQENYILKNQIKDKTSKLTDATEKLNISESKLRDMEEQLYSLVRSESNLKEELGFYKYELNKTKHRLAESQLNYTILQTKHRHTKLTLQKTELDLMECYTAKTQTFCGFEDKSICGFTQENETDDFDWTRARVQTPSGGTGPTGDHTCGPRTVGWFMYIEASAMKMGQRAILTSVKYRGLKEQCAEFHYHMFGRHIGTLNVYTKNEGAPSWYAAWRAYGNQGNTWILARMAVPEALARQGYWIIFEAITGRGYQGDIAIDDIRVSDGSCPTDNRVVAVRLPVPDSTTAPANHTQEQDTALEMTRLRKLRKYKRLFRGRNRRRKVRNNPTGTTTTTPAP